MNTTSTPPQANHATTADRYPSREMAEPSISLRQDPVVHGGPSKGPLTESQLHFFEDNGYLSLDQILSEVELGSYMMELQRLRADDAIKDAPEAVIEPESRELRSLFAVHRTSDVLRELCHHPRLVSMARQLLGSDVYIHQSRINYKSGFRGKEFFWHSDFETWHVEDGVPNMRMVSCSISLTPNTEHNGPLMLMPGSHHRFVSCVGKTPENHYQASLKRQELGIPDDASLTQLAHECGITSPKGMAGSVTFFDCNTMHGSNSNITPMPRSNVFVVYNSVENTPVAPFCGLAPRPHFIAEREDFTPVCLPGEA
ncbi:ectoine hydroxylase [Hydrogenophaga crassostreae]|uniref:Ectoine hydroxylase n=1 Tax=Hydrogenophaga crassostreae TaxID=1763535 RepID=A0A163CGW3_9BURK|nr:ectoine hydroxylase [Hydrogenophaga crassostreae]OAD42138.1 ectoine hydroxylase [Hydrogenophaga crassostreae]